MFTWYTGEGNHIFSRMGGLAPSLTPKATILCDPYQYHYHPLGARFHLPCKNESVWTSNKAMSLWSDYRFPWLTSQSDFLPHFPPCELLYCPSRCEDLLSEQLCVSAWWWLSSSPSSFMNVWTSAMLTSCCQLARLHEFNKCHESSLAPEIISGCRYRLKS